MADKLPPSKDVLIAEQGTLGQGGDTRRSDAGYHRPDPDARATSPDPAATNYVHPTAPGTVIAAPGEGIMSAGAAVDGPSHSPSNHAPADARRDPARSRSSDHIADGINRMEDAIPGGEARLSIPSDDVGPSSHSVEGMPELSDPNYSASTPGAKGTPAKDSPLRK